MPPSSIPLCHIFSLPLARIYTQPPMWSQGCCHGRGTLPVPLRQTFAPSCLWLHERHSQRCMGTHKVIVGAPPLEMGEQGWGLLGCGPRATCQRRYSMSDGQIDPLNIGGVQPSRE